MPYWNRINYSMKMNESSRAIDKKLLVNNNQNKGVVSKILPDDEMPMITELDGDKFREDSKIQRRADICLNPLGKLMLN